MSNWAFFVIFWCFQYGRKSPVYCIPDCTFYASTEKRCRIRCCIPHLKSRNYFTTFTVHLTDTDPDLTVITALPGLIPFTLPLESTVTIFLFELVYVIPYWLVNGLRTGFSTVVFPCLIVKLLGTPVIFFVATFPLWTVTVIVLPAPPAVLTRTFTVTAFLLVLL